MLVDDHPEKEEIIDGILIGRPFWAIARSVVPPFEFNAVQRYKSKAKTGRCERAKPYSELPGEAAVIERMRNLCVAEQIEAARKTELAKGEVGIRDRKPAPTLAEFIDVDFVPVVQARFQDSQR